LASKSKKLGLPIIIKASKSHSTMPVQTSSIESQGKEVNARSNNTHTDKKASVWESANVLSPLGQGRTTVSRFGIGASLCFDGHVYHQLVSLEPHIV